MATTTPNFGWSVPTSTDLVKDGATAIETLGDSIDASLVDLKGGTSGQVLAKNSGTDMDFIWVAQDDSNAIQNAIVDAKGDLIGATAADTPARLAVGANGTVLTADSAEATGLKWATPASGGGMTLLSTTTLSGATTTISSISGSYKKLRMYIFNATNDTADGTFRVAPNAVTNLIYSVGNYYYGNNVTASSGREGEYLTITQATSGGRFSRTSANNAITIEFDNYASATANKAFQAYGAFKSDNSTYRTAFTMAGFFLSTTAITSLEFSNSGGNFSAGTVLLYGVS